MQRGMVLNRRSGSASYSNFNRIVSVVEVSINFMELKIGIPHLRLAWSVLPNGVELDPTITCGVQPACIHWAEMARLSEEYVSLSKQPYAVGLRASGVVYEGWKQVLITRTMSSWVSEAG